MAEITIKIPDELKKKAEKSNLDLSKLLVELAKREIMKEQLLKQINSKEEKDITDWSVELGRKAKRDRFKLLLKEVSPKTREELLKNLPPEKRREYE